MNEQETIKTNPKLTLTYVGTDGHVIDFDFMRLLETIEAVKGAFAYQYKQNKDSDEYHVVFYENSEHIPEGCKNIDLNNMKPDTMKETNNA